MDQQFRTTLKSFESDLRNKLALKCPPTSDQKQFLQKTFKFFDIQNKGSVTKDQFVRSVGKLGVVLPDENKVEMLFTYFDRSGDGRLDIKEFSNIFIDGGKTDAEQREQATNNTQKALQQRQEPRKEEDTVTPQQLVALFREKIKARGARGIVGIQRLFKIMDDDGSRSLNEQEFAKACKDFKIGISEENIPILFTYFDSNHDGCLNIDEFLMAIRGELNERRLQLVQQAFRKIDKDNSGVLDINDIKDSYNAGKHPDVLSGKKTQDQILVEFLETFEQHHNILNGNQSDGSVSIDEFTEYYKNVSVSIDNDDYFTLVMNNSWNLKGDASPYQKYEKGWANEDAEVKKPVEWLKPQQPVQRSGKMSSDNPLTTTQKYYDAAQTSNAGRQSVATAMYQGKQVIDQQTAQEIYKKEVQRTQPQMPRNQGPAGSSLVITGPTAVPKFQSILVERFKTALQGRGSRGFVGLARQFKIMDDNGSGTLDQYEFTKAISDFGVKIDSKDIATLFKIFDIDGNNEIDFNEFIRVVVGPLNKFRANICLKAFKSIDVNEDGSLAIDDIKGRYNAKMHPDVKSGKRTEEEVLKEFLETFEQHYSTVHGTKSDGLVTPDEFLEYYANVSANIDNDAYFELMMTNAWQLDSANNPANMPFAGTSKKIVAVNSRDAYRNDHHRNLFGNDSATPFDKRKEQAWQTTNSGHYSNSGVNPSQIKAAGGLVNDPKMAWLSGSQRTTGVDYSGVKLSDDDLVKMFRDKLAARGARGLLGMQRIFKVMDDNQSGTLDIQEFWKAICDFRLPMSAEECRKLFDLFDINGDGEMSYDELMRSVAGEMNPIRKAFVKKAFVKIDKDGSGIVDIRDIQGVYNAKQHPDVKSGKKTEQEVLSEFLDTFELHHSLKNPQDKDRKITLQEFTEYYTNISSTIDRDDYFELMITNAWNLNDKTYSKGWGGEI